MDLTYLDYCFSYPRKTEVDKEPEKSEEKD